MLNKIITAAAMTLMCLGASAANAASTYQGEWSVDCGRDGYQCWWEFEPNDAGGKTYQATFFMADRMDATAVRCSFGGQGRDTGKDLALSLGNGGYRITITPMNGALRASTPERYEDDCMGAKMLGDLHPIGY